MSENKTTPELDPRVADGLAKNAAIGGSRWIEYGGMTVMAPTRDIAQAVDALRRGNRQRIMRSVNKALAKSFPAVKAERATQQLAMRCAQDIAIWFANEIIEGRATLEVS